MKIFTAIVVLIFCCAAAAANADESKTSTEGIAQSKVVTHTELPMPTGASNPPADPNIKNLIWNRRTTKNFVILSLDDDQGEYLQRNIENMKDWVTSRWGLPNVDFPNQGIEPGCMILCVPTKELMKKLFRLERSHGEVIMKDGNIEKRVLWVVLDGRPAEAVPSALTLVCLKQIEIDQKIKIGYWMQRGMAVLNSTIPQIRSRLASLQTPLSKDSEMFFSKRLFIMSEEDYRNKNSELQDLFDSEAAALCLLFRKEFGQQNMLRFLKQGGKESVLLDIYGFQNCNHLDITFKRYMYHLSSDIAVNKTPENYLQIVPSKPK